MDKYIGRLLDNRYEILEVIGTGGMAVVYKARCHRLNRLVAIKILKDDYLHDEEFRRRFHSESQAVAMLSHPNIVSVYDVSSSIMADYIVMELVDGITLKQYMEKKGILNWKETLHFGIQIAKALEHAHGRGIVHRDIKPHNVMVLKNGSVKVMDFGIARMMSQGNTLTKEALGSVHYISPEQAKGGRVDIRSDIYSLGVVMYEMMAGRPPYDGDSAVSVAIQHINGGAAMPSTLNPNIPGGLEQIIMKAMALEISDRYVSATRMLSDMDEFRKNPSLLFDYNVPPLDAVIKMPPPLVLHDPKPAPTPEVQPAPGPANPAPRAGMTAAERAARRRSGQPRHREREKKKQKQKAMDRIVAIAIIVCAVVMMVAVGVVVYLMTNGSGGEDLVKVPNLIGQVYTDEFKVDGLTIKASYEHNDTVPKDQIIEQIPTADQEVVKDSPLNIKVSLGPQEKEAPTLIDYSNMDKERAIANLESLSLDLKIVTGEKYEDYHASVKAGSVIRTEPSAGTPLKVGDTVILYVSKGPGDGDMPNVVNYQKSKAEEILDNLDLELKYDYEEIFDSEVSSGRVVKTEPAAGTQVKAEQTVKIYISKGPEMKTMPNVYGLSLADAQKKLSDAGFKNYTSDGNTQSGNVVIAQSSEQGTQVDIHKIITLTLGVKKNVTIDWTVEDPTAKTYVKIVRDGVTLVDQEVDAGVTQVVLSDQIGSGPVKYLVYIGEGDVEPWEETVNF